MRPIPKSIIALVLVGCLVAAVAVAGEPECDSPYKGRTPTPEELATVLHNHQAWLESDRKLDDERRANLCQANLQGANLAKADLTGANLQEADLIGADLIMANLQWVNLIGAKLQGAVLGYANLQGARLDGVYLQETNLLRADLTGAHLRGANLGGVYLEWGKFQGADLTEANLEGTNLAKANLQGAVLIGTKLQGANLTEANLQEANLGVAELQGADLTRANLHEVNLDWARLAQAVYEPYPEGLPRLWSLTGPYTELEKLIFHTSPAALIALREAFKKAGMRTQERQITYAIEHTRRLQAWQSWDLLENGESLFKLVAFELPSDYGMSPGRALTILVVSIWLFAPVYVVALELEWGDSGIWMVLLPDRVHKTGGETAPVRVTSTFWLSALQRKGKTRRWRALWQGMSASLISLYFSLLSAFSLGWRELNVGTWIARVQPREYTLRPTGWVRTVSGIQSLLSVYLLALWVLTYFGRPFE